MATAKNKNETKENEEKEVTYKITVENNPNYCGIGAGSLQFAYGTTKTHDEILAQWYKEHNGYKVTKG